MTVPFRRIKEILKPRAYRELMDFMEGQTIEFEGIFDDDFMRWVHKIPVID